MDRNGIQGLLLSLNAREPLTEQDKAVLADLFTEEKRFAAGAIVADPNQSRGSLHLLQAGMTAACRDLAEGRRQITMVHVPGDLLDLQAFLPGNLTHQVVALSPVRVACAAHDRLWRAIGAYPRLSHLLLMIAMVEGSVHREWIVSSGRRTSREQLASLFCELAVRLRTVEVAKSARIPMPLTQAQIADVCGISAVHINRILQELREQGLVDLRSKELWLPDFKALAEVAMFDPSYLALRPQAHAGPG